MIYRIIAEGPKRHSWVDGQWVVTGPGELRGAFLAGLGLYGWGDLPAPAVSNPRVRFWFTEVGWKEFAVPLIGEARKEGRKIRLLKRKNPPRSAVVYRDKWQVALLPVKW